MEAADGANVILSLAKYAVDSKAVEAQRILRILKDYLKYWPTPASFWIFVDGWPFYNKRLMIIGHFHIIMLTGHVYASRIYSASGGSLG